MTALNCHFFILSKYEVITPETCMNIYYYFLIIDKYNNIILYISYFKGKMAIVHGSIILSKLTREILDN